MRLEPVCDMELKYTTPFSLVRPYGGEEGTGYGEGIGTASGERLAGNVRWVNHPRRRADGTMLPDAHGLIETEDGAKIMFSLQGRTAIEEGKGRQLLTAIFEAEEDRYRWLNDAFCVFEGVITPAMTMRARVHQCIAEIE